MAVFTTLALTAGVTGLTTAGIIGAGAAIYGAGLAVAGTIKQGKAAEARASAQAKASNLQAKRQRRSAIRSNILASARARASAQASGVGQSSGIQGATGSGRSGLGAELGFGSQMSGLGGQISQFALQEQKYGALAKLGTQVAGIGMNIGGTDAFKAGAEKVDAYFGREVA
tara:strand:- start:6678 stop:7190 length:513 start_codon:yes stop_codon:yes gene_type:complete